MLLVSRVSILSHLASDELKCNVPDVSVLLSLDSAGFFATASPPKPNQNYFSILSALQRPFSRGTVHITSKDPLQKPAFDPRYFSVKSDLSVLAKAVKYCDKIVESPALKDHVIKRQDPLPEKYQSEADFEEFVKDFTSTEYHSCGTCSMGPLAKGGVVDEKLKVYNVEGLRVVDASVIPLVPSSHIVAVVYAIAEKAASAILQEHAA